LALNLGALGAVSAYVVHSISDFNLHIPANALVLAFVFGILANSGIQGGKRAGRGQMSILAWRLAAAAIGVVLAIQCARLLPGEYFAERSRAALRDRYAADSALFALKGLGYERNNPHLYFYLGRALALQAGATDDFALRDRLFEAATVELDTARTVAPLDEMFSIQLGSVYDALGRFSEAEWMYQQAIALDPNASALRRIYQTHLQKWHGSGKPPESK
jgi:tetratricopeptide (TPR) repeat protein